VSPVNDSIAWLQPQDEKIRVANNCLTKISKSMKLKPMKRSKLTDALNSKKAALKPGVFFITSFRATKDNSIQVEVCQNRNLQGRVITLLGMINQSDKRFRSDTTLLFDWLKLEPQDLINTFPTLTTGDDPLTVEDLEKVAATWKATDGNGTNAKVFQAITTIPHVNYYGKELHPVIAVTEVTHSQLIGGEFYQGENAEEKIENELKNGTAVMKTGSGDDADFIVDAETGDKIYRFTRTVMQESYENKDWDSLIPNKTSLKAYNKKSKKVVTSFVSPESILEHQEDNI